MGEANELIPSVVFFKQLTKLSVITDYMKEHYKDELSLARLAEIFEIQQA